MYKKKLHLFCKEQKIEFLSSAFDEKSIDFVFINEGVYALHEILKICFK